MTERSIKKVLVTGGAGYVGCVLIPKLLDSGYQVTVYDLMIFGDEGLPHHKDLTVIKADLRDTGTFEKAVKGHDAVIHMACIANDPSFELNPTLSKSINFDCFEPMVIAAKDAGVARFIYASSSSVGPKPKPLRARCLERSMPTPVFHRTENGSSSCPPALEKGHACTGMT